MFFFYLGTNFSRSWFSTVKKSSGGLQRDHVCLWTGKTDKVHNIPTGLKMYF